MKLLVDTHVLIWWWSLSNELPESMKRRIIDRDNDIVVSSVCAWESATKVRIGKLASFAFALPRFAQLISDHGFSALSVSIEHALLAGRLQGEHRDPFDRMLAAQAIVEDIPILSIDARLDQFGCRRIWE